MKFDKLYESIVNESSLQEANDKVYYILDIESKNIIWGYANTAKDAREGFPGFDSRYHKVVAKSQYISANS